MKLKIKYMLLGFIATTILLIGALILLYQYHSLAKKQLGMIRTTGTISKNYQKLYELCEKKYQLGIDGNFDQAYQIKGQMDQIEDSILSVN